MENKNNIDSLFQIMYMFKKIYNLCIKTDFFSLEEEFCGRLVK